MRGGRDICTKFNLPCFVVGVSHLFLLVFSLYERIWELIKLEEPFLIQDHSFVLVSLLLQLLSIFLLLVGSITGKSLYVIPWLICTAPLFFSATVYAITYVSQEEINQILLNFIVVGIIWSTWYVVIKFYLENRITSRGLNGRLSQYAESVASVKGSVLSTVFNLHIVLYVVIIKVIAMNLLNNFPYSKEKNKVYLISLLHFAMVCLGIWTLVREMIAVEEPVDAYVIACIAAHYGFHFILIFCLFVGTYIDIPLFLIPWLSATFLVYSYLTLLTFIYLNNWKTYVDFQCLLNVTYVCICWYTWYVVFSYLKTKYKNGKTCREKHLFE